MEKYPEINNSYLITFEQEKNIEIDWKIIKVLPFYKWILENQNIIKF